jgi:NAD(P)-dependent dehydrogenase (short-subunit alcohol dehydrogenase family)
MMPPSARRTLVTGASGAFGIELVRQCLSRGDRVIATCRNPARVSALADLRANFGGLELVALDPADASSVADAVPVLERVTSSLDLLVIAPAEPGAHERASDLERDEHFHSMSGTGLLEHYRRHAVSPLLLVRTLLPLLAAGDGARILVVGDSRGSLSAKREGGHYATSASAAALHMLCRTLAHDLAEQRIMVCLGNAGHVERNDDDPSLSIPLDEAAAGLLAITDRLRPDTSGCFVDWTGAERAW